MSAIAWELPEEVRAVRDGLVDFAALSAGPRFSDESKGLIGEGSTEL